MDGGIQEAARAGPGEWKLRTALTLWAPKWLPISPTVHPLLSLLSFLPTNTSLSLFFPCPLPFSLSSSTFLRSLPHLKVPSIPIPFQHLSPILTHSSSAKLHHNWLPFALDSL